MFSGIDSLLSNSNMNEQNQSDIDYGPTTGEPVIGRNGSINVGNMSANHGDVTSTRVQDIENKLPEAPALTSNDTIMQFLSSSATLPEVISAINELIKRDIRVIRYNKG